MQSVTPPLTRTASFPFLKKEAKIHPESPVQTSHKNADEDDLITASAQIKSTAQSFIEATFLRGIKIRIAPSPMTITQSLSHGANLSDMAPTENNEGTRQAPVIVNMPMAETNIAHADLQSESIHEIELPDSDDDIPPPPPLSDLPASQMALDIADKKQTTRTFFQKAPVTTLEKFTTIDALFAKHCEVDTLAADSPQEVINTGNELSIYFQKEYTKAINAELNTLWRQRIDTIPDSDIYQYLKETVEPHIAQFNIDQPWHATWIHAAFTDIKHNEAFPDETRRNIHGRLLKETKLGLLNTMSHTDTAYGEALLLPQNKPELIQILRDTVFEGFTHPRGTGETIQNLREQIIYDFFKGLFKVSYAELVHFDNFEYNRDAILPR